MTIGQSFGFGARFFEGLKSKISGRIGIHVEQGFRRDITFRLEVIFSDMFKKIINTSFSLFMGFFGELFLH